MRSPISIDSTANSERAVWPRATLAHDHKHGREVAIKVLRPDLAETLGRERFLREIQLAAA